MLKTLKKAANKLRILNAIIVEREIAESHGVVPERPEQDAAPLFVPPGHFYSPIPSLDEVKKDEARLFGNSKRTLPGIDLNEEEQLDLLKRVASFYNEMPFSKEKQGGLRYYYDNPAYSYSDAILLHGMIRYLQPKQIVEVGSGFSSCMMLDTIELFLQDKVATTFIEPYPELLLSLIKGKDNAAIEVVSSRLQDVDLSVFSKLQENDILFIDSTHVSKIGSDVNYIFFDILPILNPGVYIHFHDIFYPFEYPKGWVYEGRAWNEIYLLRAFLQFNSAFRVKLMSTYVANFHRDLLEDQMPLCLNNPGGSIWLRKEC